MVNFYVVHLEDNSDLFQLWSYSIVLAFQLDIETYFKNTYAWKRKQWQTVHHSLQPSQFDFVFLLYLGPTFWV